MALSISHCIRLSTSSVDGDSGRGDSLYRSIDARADDMRYALLPSGEIVVSYLGIREPLGEVPSAVLGTRLGWARISTKASRFFSHFPAVSSHTVNDGNVPYDDIFPA